MLTEVWWELWPLYLMKSQSMIMPQNSIYSLVPSLSTLERADPLDVGRKGKESRLISTLYGPAKARVRSWEGVSSLSSVTRPIMTLLIEMSA